MELLAIINALNALMRVGTDLGLNVAKFNAMREQAEAEGRELTTEELQALAQDSQSAIDALRDA